MKYLNRHVEDKLNDFYNFFKIILIVGARQVGKSTLLYNKFPELKKIIFDPINDEYNVRKDPDFFLNNFQAPLILDEVQYVPELLSALKRKVDESDKKGQYLLTGSQNINVLRNVAESMAGRVGILQLNGMTPYELLNKNMNVNWLETYLNDPDILVQSVSNFGNDLGSLLLFLWKGTLPGIIDAPNSIIPEYFNSYILTYIERDVRIQKNISDLHEFRNFFSLLGALTAQEINYSHLGRELGINPKTSHSWLDLLIHSYQWIELSPYTGNAIKRISGKKKGYLTDTGITCFLQKISSPDSLISNPLLGAIFETWAVNFIIRQASLLNVPCNFYHWRLNSGSEVDIILERNNTLYPIEIKCKSKLSNHDTRGIRSFNDTYKNKKIAKGLILYAGEECYPVNDFVIAMPWNGYIKKI